jgi:AraC-like DNA-binding protein
MKNRKAIPAAVSQVVDQHKPERLSFPLEKSNQELPHRSAKIQAPSVTLDSASGEPLGPGEKIFGRQIGLHLAKHVTVIRCNSARQVAWHSHEGYELILCVVGGAAYEFQDHPSIKVEGGHFLIVPPNKLHRGLHNIRMPSKICGMVLDTGASGSRVGTPFTGKDLSEIFRSFKRAPLAVRPFSRNLSEVVQLLQREHARLQENPTDLMAKASLRLCICATVLVVSQALREGTNPHMAQLVVAAKEFLKRNVDQPIGISDLVKHIGLGRTRLFQLFRLDTGMTPNDYLMRLRVDKAKELLRGVPRSILDIALDCGFGSSQYFSKVFLRYTGQTPLVYRRRPAIENRSS